MAFGFSGTVEMEHIRANADAQPATDTDIGVNERFLSHGKSLLRDRKNTIKCRQRQAAAKEYVMIFDVVVVGPLGVNCIILGCRQTGEGLVIDPGGDVDRILERVAAHKLKIVGIINTHGHFDHAGGNRRLIDITGAPLWIHQADTAMLTRIAHVSSMYGIPGENSPAADRLLEDGMEVPFGIHALRVIHTPGHTPGGCCLYLASQQILISGDTLFADGIGRTDLPGGSHEQLLLSIRTRLFTLPDQVTVWPGHGPSTTIGQEKHHNPYLD